MCCFTIHNNHSLKKGQTPSFGYIWFPFTQKYVVPSLVAIGPLILVKKIFKCHPCTYVISILSSLHLNKPLYSKMLCAKFGWNWPCSASDMTSMYFAISLLSYLSLGKGVVFHLIKLDFPSPLDALCQVCLKLPQYSEEDDKNMKSLWTDRQIRHYYRSWQKCSYLFE